MESADIDFVHRKFLVLDGGHKFELYPAMIKMVSLLVGFEVDTGCKNQKSDLHSYYSYPSKFNKIDARHFNLYIPQGMHSVER